MSELSYVAVPDAEVVASAQIRGTSLLRRSLRLWRTRIGVALVGLIVLLAIIGPYVAPYGPSTPVGAPNATPGGKAVLGTDYLGQDVLSRVLYGGRSILVRAKPSVDLPHPDSPTSPTNSPCSRVTSTSRTDQIRWPRLGS